MRDVPARPITRNAAPRIWNVVRHPIDAIIPGTNSPRMNEAAPYPPTMMPTTRPRLSGNHFEATGIGVAYPNPLPVPTIRPNAIYKVVNDVVMLVRKNPSETHIVPINAQILGPR